MAVAVIGAGFWGSAVSRLLTERHVDHIVIDDEAPTGASRAAAGICKLSWYRQQTVTKMIDGVFSPYDVNMGFDWLRQQVAIAHVPELFVNVGRGTNSEHRDNYLADPHALLVPAVTAEVDKLALHPDAVEIGGTSLDAEQVVVCAGARTDDLLAASGLGRPSGVGGLYGRAVRFDCDDFDATPECMTVMTRPYVHYTFRHLNGYVRGGDTVERKRDDKRLAELMATALRYYTGVRSVDAISGVRPVCKRMFVQRVHPRVIAATGGHRVGFGLAGAVAHRVLELL